MGAGFGAWVRKNGLRGLEFSYLKTHYSLIPTLVIGVAGNLFFMTFFIRTLTKHPEITFHRRTKIEPWNEYYNKQFKFVSSGRDYSIPSPAPKYR